jgi:hypothetical protein
MPMYDYQCECGVRFERQFRFERGKAAPPVATPCPACDAAAPRLMPETASGVFVKDVSGPVPQNTGIHSLDAHVDRVIGKAAEQGWAAHADRLKDKAEVLRDNPGVSKHALTQRPDGSWRPLTDEERGVQVRAQTINSMAISGMNRRRRKRPAPVGRT